ncbi:ABC-F family ATP-binding cassette domain-containing protein [Sinanaerobacter chloroacetimidivorans]|uniref:ABC-F family ATP-binding cassette domain-containing protein n=1 Tax=Sinanaerobacter chloroacetimidivorans TaxID=2818044 RepID=A0A8J8B0V6_9FIRM|nr:ABC-F family ATP-binding cassette domain-containing protein [Sinanaerobacter chloroacetimidivorans]MBR0597564.1 ABC-F family ATP-binding cassette domain-containing protein [Sinanaerobacter chloroacetimidivorans]
MSLLVVENVTHGFGARRILEDASFRLLKGEHVGLIGANGEGKSTFLNIITGQLAPDEGRIEWSKRATVGYLDQHSSLKKGMTIREVLREAFQHMFDLEQEMLSIYEAMATAEEGIDDLMEEAGEIQLILEHSGFYTLDTKIEEVANGLGLGSIGLDKDVSDLSGGQRTKVLLTKLLLADPSILILDEPTNYLDAEHIEWLTRYLQEYENSFILVSHDMEFLNSVVNVIYHVNDGELTRYSGNYEKFMQMYAVKKNQELKAYEKQQQEIERMEDFIARNKARVATRGMANSRQKMLDKMEVLERPREKPKPSFEFRDARTPSRFIVEGKEVTLGYGEPLTKSVSFTLERGQKIAVVGTNGLGKTTLLKTILGKIEPIDGKIELGDFLQPGYFEQEADRDNSETALESVWREFPSYTNAEVRAALAKCGLTNEHITSQMKVLSGGENAKVRLCKLMQRDSNWLILDEPTNHLDVEAKEELKRALIAFKGTILLVCHEPEFYRDWITDVWNVEDWTLKII